MTERYYFYKRVKCKGAQRVFYGLEDHIVLWINGMEILIKLKCQWKNRKVCQQNYAQKMVHAYHSNSLCVLVNLHLIALLFEIWIDDCTH